MRKVKLFSTLALAVAIYTAMTVGTAAGREPLRRAPRHGCSPRPWPHEAAPCRSLMSFNVAHGPAGVGWREAGANFLATVRWFRRHRWGDRKHDAFADPPQIGVLNNTFGGGEGGADSASVQARRDHSHRQRRWFNSSIGGAEHDMSGLRQGDEARSTSTRRPPARISAGRTCRRCWLSFVRSSTSTAWSSFGVLEGAFPPGTRVSSIRVRPGRTRSGTGSTSRHVLREVHGARRFRRRHSVGEDRDVRLSGRQGRVLPRATIRSYTWTTRSTPVPRSSPWVARCRAT